MKREYLSKKKDLRNKTLCKCNGLKTYSKEPFNQSNVWAKFQVIVGNYFLN